MGFSINASGKLLRDGRIVEQVPARTGHTGGPFPSTPKIIVMHFTSGGTGRSSAEWFRDPTNSGKSSAHVVVDRDGSVIQCVAFDTVAHHAGKSKLGTLVGLNRFAYGIELANWGGLQRKANGWTSFTGVSIPDPVLAVHRNGNPDGSTAPMGWEPYPQAQIDAAIGIAQAIVALSGADQIVGHDDISKGRKWDPGPAFDMLSFRARVLEDMGSDDDNLLHVDVAEGLNLRRGPGTAFEAIELLANRTPLRLVERSGNWLMVNVVNAGGVPIKTGWVHSAFVQ
ncbi:MAG TPA: N-acetylmuramoyl-L-alanine amidase [Tabrizicola sp.]|jgi:N-acetylmuramoyl-L-alanine amidase